MHPRHLLLAPCYSVSKISAHPPTLQDAPASPPAPSTPVDSSSAQVTRPAPGHADTAAGGLARSLGVESWPYGEAALVEALKAHCASEQSRQELYRLERTSKLLEVLNLAAQMGVPGTDIHSVFECPQPQLPLQTQSQQPQGNPGPLLRSFYPNQTRQQQQQQQQQQQLLGRPGPVVHVPADASTPFQHRPHSSVSELDSRSMDSYALDSSVSERFVLGHVPSASAAPAFGSQSPGVPLPPGPGSPQVPLKVPQNFVFPPNYPSPRASASSQISLPPLAESLAQNSQNLPTMPPMPTMTGMPTMPPMQHPQSGPAPTVQPSVSTPSGSNGPSGSPGRSPMHSTPGQHYKRRSRQSQSSQGQLASPASPGPGNRLSRVKVRPHRYSQSASDLQIHQWNPNLINIDNRWKTNSSPKFKDKRHEEGLPPSKQHVASSSNESIQRSPTISPLPQQPQQTMQPIQPLQPLQPSHSQSSVVAAHNNKRRSAGHAHRSSVTFTPMKVPDLSHKDDTESDKSTLQHDEGVAVLASLASNHQK